MKTPREILLQHHQTAAPKLDTARNNVLKAELSREGRRSAVPKFKVADTATFPLLIWRELIWPSRRIWAGLAAVWILILAANVSMRDHSQYVAEKSSPTPEIIMTWRQQERLLAELIGPNEVRVAQPPKPFLPRPRSERRFETLAA